MASNISFASTVFGGGGNEEVATPDIYSSSVSADDTLTSFKSGANDIGNSLGKVFKVSKFNPKDVVSIIDVKNGIGLDKDALLKRIEESAGFRTDRFSSIQQQMQKSALADFAKASGLGSTGLIDKNGNINPLLTGDKVTARGVMEMVDGITGSSFLKQFPDIEAQVAFLGKIVSVALDLGLPDIIDGIMDKFENEEAKRAVLISNLTRCAKAGDLDSLYKIKDYIGARDMYARCPKLVSYVMQGYIFPTSGTQPDYRTVYNRMVGLFNEVQPDWDYVTRDTVKIGRLEPFCTASEATKKIFSAVGGLSVGSGISHITLTLIASSYPKNQLLALARKSFPKAAFKN